MFQDQRQLRITGLMAKGKRVHDVRDSLINMASIELVRFYLKPGKLNFLLQLRKIILQPGDGKLALRHKFVKHIVVYRMKRALRRLANLIVRFFLVVPFLSLTIAQILTTMDGAPKLRRSQGIIA